MFISEVVEFALTPARNFAKIEQKSHLYFGQKYYRRACLDDRSPSWGALTNHNSNEFFAVSRGLKSILRKYPVVRILLKISQTTLCNFRKQHVLTWRIRQFSNGVNRRIIKKRICRKTIGIKYLVWLVIRVRFLKLVPWRSLAVTTRKTVRLKFINFIFFYLTGISRESVSMRLPNAKLSRFLVGTATQFGGDYCTCTKWI